MTCFFISSDILNVASKAMQELALAAASIAFSFLLAFCFILLGWYVVWKLFLSRFKFVRELLGGANDNTPSDNTRHGRSKTRKPRRE